MVLGSVTPFGSTSDYFTYNITIDNKANASSSLNLSTITLHILSNGYSDNASLTGTKINSTAMHYTYSGKLSPIAIFRYNVSYVESNGTVVYSGYMGGPIHGPWYNLIPGYLYIYLPAYLIYFELIFVAGFFIGRSMSNSMRYRQRNEQNKPPEQGNP